MQDNVYTGPSGLFACYLLHSEVKEKAYIGYTPDPRQRLRKHNREITGGARETGRDGPWRMLLFVGGFATEVSALQFEREWQQPQDTKVTKLQIDNCASLSPTKCMDTLENMLNLKQWANQPLRVCYLDLPWFQKYGLIVKGRYEPNYLYKKGCSIPAERIYHKEEAGTCKLCENALSPYNCRCHYCEKRFCMECMAQLLIADRNELIPSTGTCTCGAQLHWKEILRRKELEDSPDLDWQRDRNSSANSEGISEDNEAKVSDMSEAEEEEPGEVFAPPSPVVNGIDELCQLSPQLDYALALVQLTPNVADKTMNTLQLDASPLDAKPYERSLEQEVISID